MTPDAASSASKHPQTPRNNQRSLLEGGVVSKPLPLSTDASAISRHEQRSGVHVHFGARTFAQCQLVFPRMGMVCAGLSIQTKEADEGVGCGPGGPPHFECKLYDIGKTKSHCAGVRAPHNSFTAKTKREVIKVWRI